MKAEPKQQWIDRDGGGNVEVISTTDDTVTILRMLSGKKTTVKRARFEKCFTFVRTIKEKVAKPC